jgi:hypothetical protein
MNHSREERRIIARSLAERNDRTLWFTSLYSMRRLTRAEASEWMPIAVCPQDNSMARCEKKISSSDSCAGFALVSHPGKVPLPQARPRCCSGAAARLRHPPSPNGGLRSVQTWIVTVLDGRASRGPSLHTPAKTLGAHRLAPVRKREAIYSSPRAPHLQSRGSLPGRSRNGMEQPASRITEARAPGLREPGRSAVPQDSGGRRGLFEPCLGQAGGHGEFRSRATATRSAVEPTCLSRAGCSIPSHLVHQEPLHDIRYPTQNLEEPED